MNFEDFEHLARLYVVGVLDDEELEQFREARREFGERAEDYIRECRNLSAAFALSLRPRAAQPATKEAEQSICIDSSGDAPELKESLQFRGKNERILC